MKASSGSAVAEALAAPCSSSRRSAALPLRRADLALERRQLLADVLLAHRHAARRRGGGGLGGGGLGGSGAGAGAGGGGTCPVGGEEAARLLLGAVEEVVVAVVVVGLRAPPLALGLALDERRLGTELLADAVADLLLQLRDLRLELLGTLVVALDLPR